MKTGILILGAGNSSRLGEPKQLLEFEGKSLLKNSTDESLINPEHSVVVVLGAYANETIREVDNTRAKVIINPDWQKGMATSIVSGLKELLTIQPELQQCIISVCDQPYLNAKVFESLKKCAAETNKGIITTGYSQTFGVPVLFSKSYFEELLKLEGQQGAKEIVKRHTTDMVSFPFEPAATDIDTKEDYQRLNRHLISPDKARELIYSCLPDPKITPGVALSEAFGYTLAADVIGAKNIPGFLQSSMDGYAIRFDEMCQELKIADRIQAGSTQQKTLKKGDAIRIYTGAPLPSGADTVVMQEKILKTDNETILILDRNLKQGDNVRGIGSEAKEGAVALKKGTYLTPAAIGFLAGIGCTKVDIFAAPNVGIIITGNELKPPGSAISFGEVFESNSYQLTSALSELGVKVRNVYYAKDEKEQLTRHIKEALEEHDIVIAVGGVSVGDYDFVVESAIQCGLKHQFHKIRQKPGKPMFFATAKDKLFFGLPGNPSSALTCFYLYIEASINHLMKLPEKKRIIKAVAAADFEKKTGLTHFIKAHYDGKLVSPLHAQESYRLQSYAQSNCLLILEEDSTGCKAGEEVRIKFLNC